MNCPDPRAIESLACGAGDEKERLALMDHVANCANCRQEWAFVRLIQIQHLAQTPKEGHLDDEAFCALADRAMDEKQSQQALAHLAACPSCLSQWVGLHRNLESAEKAEQAPPAALIEKALSLAKADTEEPAESWWSSLFNVARPWQWGLALGTAAAVLLATLWFSAEVPPQQVQLDLTQLQKLPSVADVKDIAPEGPGPVLPHPPKETPPVLADAPPPKPKRPQATPPIDLADLARRSLPLERLQTRLAHGLTDPGTDSLKQSFKLGRLLTYNQRFAKAGAQAEIRQLLASNTKALAEGLKQSGQAKLAGMADDLVMELKASSPALDVLQVRLDVLHQATAEWLNTDPRNAAGACLGKLSQSWRMRPKADRKTMALLLSCRNRVASLGSDDPAQKAILPLMDTLAQTQAKANQFPNTIKALEDQILTAP
ncbi:MAG: hypothetical protein JRF33_07365 [Deltaproteobacteria bacterium]|nr:hypothetical protein [Deltaproteobacteria bacterium]